MSHLGLVDWIQASTFWWPSPWWLGCCMFLLKVRANLCWNLHVLGGIDCCNQATIHLEVAENGGFSSHHGLNNTKSWSNVLDVLGVPPYGLGHRHLIIMSHSIPMISLEIPWSNPIINDIKPPFFQFVFPLNDIKPPFFPIFSQCLSSNMATHSTSRRLSPGWSCPTTTGSKWPTPCGRAQWSGGTGDLGISKRTHRKTMGNLWGNRCLGH